MVFYLLFLVCGLSSKRSPDKFLVTFEQVFGHRQPVGMGSPVRKCQSLFQDIDLAQVTIVDNDTSPKTDEGVGSALFGNGILDNLFELRQPYGNHQFVAVNIKHIAIVSIGIDASHQIQVNKIQLIPCVYTDYIHSFIKDFKCLSKN